jgi:antitoxin (DNA-binding transcriptional repressor) of toxin-antitoxin stability system
MPTITATDLARHTREILDKVSNQGEVFAVERNHSMIATISPAEPTMTAAHALAQLPGPMLTASQATDWLLDSRNGFDDAVPSPRT